MRWLSSWSAPLHVPAKDDVPSCERCRHPARAHNDATSCSVRGFWGRRCRCSGYVIVAAADDSMSSSTATIFISHAHEDDNVARQLTVALDQEGVKPWLEAQELRVGDELLDSIGQALAKVDYFALLLSRAALTKRWVLAETQMALSAEIEVGRPRVLVLLLEDCEVPVTLRHKKFLDFRGRFDSAVAELIKQLKGVDLSITAPKQAVVAGIIANADAELWQEL
jgi:hypothetical protein